MTPEQTYDQWVTPLKLRHIKANRGNDHMLIVATADLEALRTRIEEDHLMVIPDWSTYNPDTFEIVNWILIW